MTPESYNKRVEFLQRYARGRKKFDLFKKKSDIEHIAGRIGAGYSMIVISAFAIYRTVTHFSEDFGTMRTIALFFFPTYAAWALWDLMRMKQGYKILEEAGAENVSDLGHIQTMKAAKQASN